jgi:hypothetical protein
VQGGGGFRCGRQREGQEEMKTVGVHDAAHCRAKSEASDPPGGFAARIRTASAPAAGRTVNLMRYAPGAGRAPKFN